MYNIENENQPFSGLEESIRLEESVNPLEESVRQLFILFDNKECICLTHPTGRKTLFIAEKLAKSISKSF